MIARVFEGCAGETSSCSICHPGTVGADVVSWLDISARRTEPPQNIYQQEYCFSVQGHLKLLVGMNCTGSRLSMRR